MSKVIEQLLFTELEVSADADVASPVFILGAPRTGSTTIYKAMATYFKLPFIANITNDHFSETPIVGMAIQKSMPAEISWQASYGKTKGTFQPSEGSAVLGNWFGGGHPSQVVSHEIKVGMQEHFILTLNAIQELFGAPLLTKNPWNCFRVKYLATALPKARFIWLQRDLVETASSDLYARYVNQVDINDWNSATPANYKELQKCSPVTQVVENQFEFNKALQENLNRYAKGRWINIWFEDFLTKRDEVLEAIASRLNLEPFDQHTSVPFDASEKKALSIDEQQKIANYIKSSEHYKRLNSMRYNGKE